MYQLERLEQRQLKFAAPVLVAAVVGIVVWVSAGDLNPPPGPVTPTMKTLTEVEPRTPVESLSGDAGALYVIDEPGSYYLTGNVTGVSGKNGIEITTNGVTLDLNGFALIGVPGSYSAVLATGSIMNLVVRNGTIEKWEALSYGTAVSVNVINGQLERLHVANNAGHGISAIRCTVANCSACDNVGNGIAISQGTVVNCVAQRNNHGIVAVNSSVVTCCTANDNGSGFHGTLSTFAHCNAFLNDGDGISVTKGTVVNCTVSMNQGDGIEASHYCYVLENTCYSNGSISSDGAGIYASLVGNRIEANNVMNNVRGIAVDGTGNLIIKNSTRGSTGTGSPSANYDIVAGNDYGQIVSSPGAGFTNSNPWANFEF